MYNDSVDENLKAKNTFFAKILSTKFNLDFDHLLAICSCDDCQEKQRLISCLAVHKGKAKAFHALTKETPYASVTYAFNLQLVQPLPKLNIGEAFYSRQVSFYCLYITDVPTEHPQFNAWDENASRKNCEKWNKFLILLDTIRYTGRSQVSEF
nr:unnamed protein product [Callosobruchus analis]